MKIRIATFLLLAVSVHGFAPARAAALQQTKSVVTGGILRSINNASITHSKSQILLTPKDPNTPITLTFTHCQGLGVDYSQHQWWVLPISKSGAQIQANRALWILPVDPESPYHAWRIQLHNGALTAQKTSSGLTATLHAQSITLSQAAARPHSDPLGHRFAFHITGGPTLANTLAAFYWGTMLPSVAEKTLAAHFPYSSGYVLSTLSPHSYPGSYPSVDHEFQIRGRIAIASPVDLDIVRRMIDLQFQLMQDDPEHLYRDPTSVQPDGHREYHVRRDSENHRVNAAMFPITGNTEVLEESWRYYQATKNLAWLRASIIPLEHSANWVLFHTDQYGRVWSDVYYEDQVMKDGRVTQAQAFAAHAFSLLAKMETLLGRTTRAARYAKASRKMAQVLIAPLPMGYWNPKTQRFIDWVDRNGEPHDHIHLLANELPVTFGYATPAQAAAVRHLLAQYNGQFERFPSFVAAKIADYTPSEIGDGGPYDLCAAGRYWYWDAAYRAARHQNTMLFHQLMQVSAEAAKSGYYMSERYDMDYVYYIDGKDAHGAEMYYEYPNVFAAVLLDKYLGLSFSTNANLSVAPHLTGYGSITLQMPKYNLRYTYRQTGFTLTNLANKPRTFQVDLSALHFSTAHFQLATSNTQHTVGPRTTLILPAHATAKWTPQP
jgi:hypothetical protein